MSDPNSPVGFFCHVMKTGGTALRWMLLESVLQPHELAPYAPNASKEERLTLHVINPFWIRDKLPEDLGPVRVIAGHYPFLASELFADRVKTFSLLRDPVERVVSHLRHVQRDSFPNRSYEDLYFDSKMFRNLFYNLQARAFVFDQTDRAPTLMRYTFDWDEPRLSRAKENLARLDVLGLSTEFEAFVRNLEIAFGWKFKRIIRSHEAPCDQSPVPDSLRRRMRDDLEYDLRFYEHAVRHYEERQRATARSIVDLGGKGLD